MKHIILTFLLACLVTFTKSQVKLAPPAKDYSKTIMMQADSIGALLLNRNYVDFARYTYPKIVDAMGSRDSMAHTLGRMMGSMAAQVMQITKITFRVSSQPVSVDKQLQCTVPKTMQMKVLSEHMVAKSTLVGVSDDGGRHWNFIDISNTDNPLLPELSKSW